MVMAGGLAALMNWVSHFHNNLDILQLAGIYIRACKVLKSRDTPVLCETFPNLFYGITDDYQSDSKIPKPRILFLSLDWLFGSCRRVHQTQSEQTCLSFLLGESIWRPCHVTNDAHRPHMPPTTIIQILRSGLPVGFWLFPNTTVKLCHKLLLTTTVAQRQKTRGLGDWMRIQVGFPGT